MKTTVRIASPVKLAGQVFMPGVHDVDGEIADEMKAAGVLAPEGEEVEAPAAELVPMTAAEIDRQVADRAQIIAETIVASAVEQAVTELVKERDAALARAEAAEARLVAIEAEATKQATGSEDPVTPAAKAPKKAAAAKG